MPKARQVLAALKRDGWVEVRVKGSHRKMRKGDNKATWAYHQGFVNRSRWTDGSTFVWIARRMTYGVSEERSGLVFDLAVVAPSSGP